jgi:hypothetical protein
MPPEDSSQSEEERDTGDWSDSLAHEGNSKMPVSECDTASEFWNRWYYGVYLGAGLLLVGAYKGSLLLLVGGYLLVPITMYLDSRYLESVTTGWQPDVGLYVIGSLLFPVLMVPAYLYKRRELQS